MTAQQPAPMARVTDSGAFGDRPWPLEDHARISLLELRKTASCRSVRRTASGQTGATGLLARRVVEEATQSAAVWSESPQSLVARPAMDMTKWRASARPPPARQTVNGLSGASGQTARCPAPAERAAVGEIRRQLPHLEGSTVLARASRRSHVQRKLAHRTACGQRGRDGQYAQSPVVVAKPGELAVEVKRLLQAVCHALALRQRKISATRVLALATVSGAPGVDGLDALGLVAVAS